MSTAGRGFAVLGDPLFIRAFGAVSSRHVRGGPGQRKSALAFLAHKSHHSSVQSLPNSVEVLHVLCVCFGGVGWGLVTESMPPPVHTMAKISVTTDKRNICRSLFHILEDLRLSGI